MFLSEIRIWCFGPVLVGTCCFFLHEQNVEKCVQIKEGSEVTAEGPRDLTKIASSKDVGVNFAA